MPGAVAYPLIDGGRLARLVNGELSALDRVAVGVELDERRRKRSVNDAVGEGDGHARGNGVAQLVAVQVNQVEAGLVVRDLEVLGLFVGQLIALGRRDLAEPVLGVLGDDIVVHQAKGHLALGIARGGSNQDIGVIGARGVEAVGGAGQGRAGLVDLSEAQHDALHRVGDRGVVIGVIDVNLVTHRGGGVLVAVIVATVGHQLAAGVATHHHDKLHDLLGVIDRGVLGLGHLAHHVGVGAGGGELKAGRLHALGAHVGGGVKVNHAGLVVGGLRNHNAAILVDKLELELARLKLATNELLVDLGVHVAGLVGVQGLGDGCHRVAGKREVHLLGGVGVGHREGVGLAVVGGQAVAHLGGVTVLDVQLGHGVVDLLAGVVDGQVAPAVSAVGAPVVGGVKSQGAVALDRGQGAIGVLDAQLELDLGRTDLVEVVGVVPNLLDVDGGGRDLVVVGEGEGPGVLVAVNLLDVGGVALGDLGLFDGVSAGLAVLVGGQVTDGGGPVVVCRQRDGLDGLLLVRPVERAHDVDGHRRVANAVLVVGVVPDLGDLDRGLGLLVGVLKREGPDGVAVAIGGLHGVEVRGRVALGDLGLLDGVGVVVALGVGLGKAGDGGRPAVALVELEGRDGLGLVAVGRRLDDVDLDGLGAQVVGVIGVVPGLVDLDFDGRHGRVGDGDLGGVGLLVEGHGAGGGVALDLGLLDLIGVAGLGRGVVLHQVVPGGSPVGGGAQGHGVANSLGGAAVGAAVELDLDLGGAGLAGLPRGVLPLLGDLHVGVGGLLGLGVGGREGPGHVAAGCIGRGFEVSDGGREALDGLLGKLVVVGHAVGVRGVEVVNGGLPVLGLLDGDVLDKLVLATDDAAVELEGDLAGDVGVVGALPLLLNGDLGRGLALVGDVPGVAVVAHRRAVATGLADLVDRVGVFVAVAVDRHQVVPGVGPVVIGRKLNRIAISHSVAAVLPLIELGLDGRVGAALGDAGRGEPGLVDRDAGFLRDGLVRVGHRVSPGSIAVRIIGGRDLRNRGLVTLDLIFNHRVCVGVAVGVL